MADIDVDKVIFIASLMRSGSTLLDLMLGGHPRYVGLGEVFLLIKENNNRLERTAEEFCSCGSRIDDCDFWGSVCAKLREDRATSVPERYAIVFDAFRRFFGEDKIPVDSSKSVQALQSLTEVPKIELQALFLIRDVRSWTTSVRDARRRAHSFYLSDLVQKHGWKAFRHLLTRTGTYCFQSWHYSNRKLQRTLGDNKIPTFQLGYEELSLYPQIAVQSICEFLGVEPVNSMYSLSDSGSHSILGNRMRLQDEKRGRIVYDNRWFCRNDWLLPAVLFRNLMQFNSQQVYQNTRESLWSK
jgi:hypothetical protein